MSGTINVGGLIGSHQGTALSNVYATGSVGGITNVGGLIGFCDVTNISNAFWDTQTTGRNNAVGFGNSVGVTGVTTAQLHQMSTFTGWNISNTVGSSAVVILLVVLR